MDHCYICTALNRCYACLVAVELNVQHRTINGLAWIKFFTAVYTYIVVRVVMLAAFLTGFFCTFAYVLEEQLPSKHLDNSLEKRYVLWLAFDKPGFERSQCGCHEQYFVVQFHNPATSGLGDVHHAMHTWIARTKAIE
jgi:hypothetical protein